MPRACTEDCQQFVTENILRPNRQYRERIYWIMDKNAKLTQHAANSSLKLHRSRKWILYNLEFGWAILISRVFLTTTKPVWHNQFGLPHSRRAWATCPQARNYHMWTLCVGRYPCHDFTIWQWAAAHCRVGNGIQVLLICPKSSHLSSKLPHYLY